MNENKKIEPFGIINVFFIPLVFFLVSATSEIFGKGSYVPLVVFCLTFLIPIIAIFTMIRIFINKSKYSKLGYFLGFLELIIAVPLILFLLLVALGPQH